MHTARIPGDTWKRNRWAGSEALAKHGFSDHQIQRQRHSWIFLVTYLRDVETLPAERDGALVTARTWNSSSSHYCEKLEGAFGEFSSSDRRQCGPAWVFASPAWRRKDKKEMEATTHNQLMVWTKREASLAQGTRVFQRSKSYFTPN